MEPSTLQTLLSSNAAVLTATFFFAGACVTSATAVTWWVVRRSYQFVDWPGLKARLKSEQDLADATHEDLRRAIEGNHADLVAKYNEVMRATAEERRLIFLSLKEHRTESRAEAETMAKGFNLVQVEVGKLGIEVANVKKIVDDKLKAAS